MATLKLKKDGKLAAIDTTLKDHSNDAFVVKKLASAKRLIKKFGLPKDLKK